MSVIAILQARTSSTRLPGKVLRPILGRPMLARQIDRVAAARTLDRIVVATSTAPDDDAIAALCDSIDIACFRGALDDVLGRFDACAEAFPADHVVRLTGDCPLIDPVVIDRVVAAHLQGGADYTSNVRPPTWPDGLDVEVMRRAVLAAAAAETRRPSDREHVTSFIADHPDRFALRNIVADEDRSGLRLTVDELRDFELVAQIFGMLFPSRPDFSIDDVLALLDLRPDLLAINAGIRRNEGLLHSREREAGLSIGEGTKGDR